MRIALDATYSTGKNLSGVGVYCREILSGLAATHPEARFYHCYRPHRLLRGLAESRQSNCSARPLPWPWFGEQPHIFHGLNQRLTGARGQHSVVTYHDLFALTGDYSTPEFRSRSEAISRETAGRADRIICVSAYTAGVVESLLKVEKARLRVVHHGVRFPDEAGSTRCEPIVLHVGAIQKRKNLTMLVRAFEKASAPPWRLVLAGAQGYGAEETLAEIEGSPARGRMAVTGWVSDDELQSWYRRSSIFAFPSWDEGFGIPVLEAMAQGLPVLCSDRGALPEVCGDAGWLLDASAEDLWTHALRTWMGDESERAQFAALGRKRAASFTWAAAAAATWGVYAEFTGRIAV